MMSGYKSWPDEAIEHIQVIAAERDVIEAIITTCIDLVRNRQGHRVEPFVPDIEKKALEIERRAALVQAMNIRTAGRTPRWADAAMEIRLLAQKLVRMTDYLRDNLPGNRFKSVLHLLRLGRDVCGEIHTELHVVPLPDAVNDLEKIANEAWEE